jgi:hypothetical protein
MAVQTFDPNVHIYGQLAEDGKTVVINIVELRRALQQIRIQVPIADFEAATAPTTTDDITKGWKIGSKWIFNHTIYECSDNTENAAVWQQMIGTNEVAGGVAGSGALDGALDYLGVHDFSEDANKRVTLNELVTAGGGRAQTIVFAALSEPQAI